MLVRLHNLVSNQVGNLTRLRQCAVETQNVGVTIKRLSTFNIAPALHRNTVCVSTGELILPTASESEEDVVGGVGRAGTRVVVHRPL